MIGRLALIAFWPSREFDPKQRTIAFLGDDAETEVDLRAVCPKTNAGFSNPRPRMIELKLRH